LAAAVEEEEAEEPVVDEEAKVGVEALLSLVSFRFSDREFERDSGRLMS
jgi:hypothetical protein